MRGDAYKIIVSETREISTLPKGLFPGRSGGGGGLQFIQLQFGWKFLRTPLCKRSIINVNWLFHLLFENRAVLHFPCLLANQSVTHWLLYMQVQQINLNIHSMEVPWWTHVTAINLHLEFNLSCSFFRNCLEGNTWHPELHY